MIEQLRHKKVRPVMPYKELLVEVAKILRRTRKLIAIEQAKELVPELAALIRRGVIQEIRESAKGAPFPLEIEWLVKRLETGKP